MTRHVAPGTTSSSWDTDCNARPLRCDDTTERCVVEHPEHAEGFTYAGDDAKIQPPRLPAGGVALRVVGMVFSLSAISLLVIRSITREAAARAVFATTALVASTAGIGLVYQCLYA